MACQSTTGCGGEASAHFFALHGLTDSESLAQVHTLLHQGRLRHAPGSDGVPRFSAVLGAPRQTRAGN
jgi:hypothetical protein